MEKQKERTSPADYNLPYESWRPHQKQITVKLLAKPSNSVTILHAPVGSGKTPYLKAMSVSERGVTGLVKTRLLQQSNYRDDLSFDILFGKSNYPCPHPEQTEPDPTAAMCLFDREMGDCDYASECPFIEH
jgi:hypothetical protein